MPVGCGLLTFFGDDAELIDQHNIDLHRVREVAILNLKYFNKTR